MALTFEDNCSSAPSVAIGTANDSSFSPPATFREDIIPTLLAWRRAGARGALVTLVDVEGSSPRRIGSQIAVREDGLWIGQITSGCAEAAIAAEAVKSIRTLTPRTRRYGRGSKYLDVKLPCGSGIDVLIDPIIPTSILEELERTKASRKVVELWTPKSFHQNDYQVLVCKNKGVGNKGGMSVSADYQIKRYLPTTRLMIAGRGSMLSAMCKFGQLLDWELAIASPERQFIDGNPRQAVRTQHLTRPEDFSNEAIDPWTASVVLFHDHEWEPIILSRMLESSGFYFGALGSHKTQKARLDALLALGITRDRCQQIRGPVGLNIGAGNPLEIALSIAAEITEQRSQIG